MLHDKSRMIHARPRYQQNLILAAGCAVNLGISLGLALVLMRHHGIPRDLKMLTIWCCVALVHFWRRKTSPLIVRYQRYLTDKSAPRLSGATFVFVATNLSLVVFNMTPLRFTDGGKIFMSLTGIEIPVGGFGGTLAFAGGIFLMEQFVSILQRKIAPFLD